MKFVSYPVSDTRRSWMSTEQVAAAEPAPPGRIERKRGRRVQEILATAAALFGERGYDAVSLEDVADRLDVTKGSLYYYFASKDELVTAAIETLGNEWTARLEGLLAGQSGAPAERLHALVREHIGIAVREYSRPGSRSSAAGTTRSSGRSSRRGSRTATSR
jgi:AcrR family transcriptional regulator